MNARTQRAYELAGAAFLLCRTNGELLTDERTRDITLLWVQRAGPLSARVYTKDRCVFLEIWMGVRVLAVNRATGAADCQVEQYQRGGWEAKLLRLAIEGAELARTATVH